MANNQISVMNVIIEGVIDFIFWLFFEIFLVWSGEIILFFITLGKHQPKWDL